MDFSSAVAVSRAIQKNNVMTSLHMQIFINSFAFLKPM